MCPESRDPRHPAPNAAFFTFFGRQGVSMGELAAPGPSSLCIPRRSRARTRPSASPPRRSNLRALAAANRPVLTPLPAAP